MYTCTKTLMSMCTKTFYSCLILCDSRDYSPHGSSVHGILQARILELVAIPPPGDLPNPGIKHTSVTSYISCSDRGVLNH